MGDGFRPSRRGLLAAMAAFALPAPLAALPLDKLKARGTLRIAVYRDFEPWSWAQGGKFVGIDVDLGTRLAAELGLKPEIVDFLADESVEDDLRNMVWRGSLVGGTLCDVMMHVPTDRRFSVQVDRAVIGSPYYREGFAIACGPGADCEVPPPQWKGRRLAAELDSIPDIYLSGGFGGVLRADVKHLMSGAAAINAVRAGEADVVMATHAQLEHAFKDGAGDLKLRKGPLPAVPSPGWDIGIAVKDDSRDLSDALDAIIEKLRADGSIDAILKSYGVLPRAPLRAV